MILKMTKNDDSPRGRYIRAHLRRSQLNPGEYFRVTDYQERFDRVRIQLRTFNEFQHRFQFTFPQQYQDEDDSPPPDG